MESSGHEAGAPGMQNSVARFCPCPGFQSPPELFPALLVSELQVIPADNQTTGLFCKSE